MYQNIKLFPRLVLQIIGSKVLKEKYYLWQGESEKPKLFFTFTVTFTSLTQSCVNKSN